MSEVNQLLKLTEDLIHILEAENDRYRKIKMVEQMLEEQQGFIDKLLPPYSDSDKELGAQIIQINHRLNTLLQKEKVLIQKDIKDLSVKKESNHKYANPYQALATDGVFYDKRK